MSESRTNWHNIALQLTRMTRRSPRRTFFLVIAALCGLALSSTGGKANDIGAFGGPGGGVFRTMCDPGGEIVGFDTMEKNGVIVRIAPVCAKRQLSATDTYGRPWIGTDTGTTHNPRCEPSAVVTILQVFVGKIPLVSRVGFTCWNVKNNNMTNSYPNYGGDETTNQRLICPTGQVAVGIYGHAGTAIDQLGLVCDNWQTVISPPATAALGQKIVAYAQQHLGQCFTDPNGHTQAGACPPTANNDTTTGPGECTYLVQSAVVGSGGQAPNYNVAPITATDNDVKPPKQISGLPYTWGDPVGPPYQPGDIIQLAAYKLQGPNGATMSSDSQHTAIVQSANGNDLTVLQEHAPVRVVTQGEINLNWTLVRGKIQVFRPRPK
jgi:hypothetical protein